MKTSVLINNFNNAPFLEECVRSVLAQKRPPDEVIFYDDGSTDSSLAVIAPYADRLKVISAKKWPGTPIQNQAIAIYTAFKECSGDVVFLLDGDDVFLPEKLKAYVEVFETTDAIMVQAPLLKIDRSSRVIGLEFDQARHQRDYLTHVYNENELNVYYPTSALAFRRSYLDRRLPLNCGPGQRVWPDAQLALIAPHFGRVVALPQPYTLWRRHPRSHTVATPLSVYRMVRHNQEYFNSFCQLTRKPQMAPWRSTHHWLRSLRHYLVADALEEISRKVRWVLMSKRKRQEMLAGADVNSLLKRLNVLAGS